MVSNRVVVRLFNVVVVSVVLVRSLMVTSKLLTLELLLGSPLLLFHLKLALLVAQVAVEILLFVASVVIDTMDWSVVGLGMGHLLFFELALALVLPELVGPLLLAVVLLLISQVLVISTIDFSLVNGGFLDWLLHNLDLNGFNRLVSTTMLLQVGLVLYPLSLRVRICVIRVFL